MKKLSLLLLLLLPLSVFAAEASDGVALVLSAVAPFLASYAEKYEWVRVFLTVMLYSRIIVKPLMSALVEVGSQVPEGKFRKFMSDMSGHWAYKGAAYLLDWFASIKLPKKS
jgi:hypothetical protein